MKNSKWEWAAEKLERACKRERKSRQTFKSYLSWVRSYARWLKSQATEAMTSEEKVSGYLETLSGHSVASQKQALNAIVYFYKKAIAQPLGKLPSWTYARRPVKIPTWLTPAECLQLFQNMKGQPRLISELMFGSGLRLKEAICLRIQDIDFESCGVKVRSGKGNKDRVSCLPKSLIPALREQVERCSNQWREDRQQQVDPVVLPAGLERKFPRGGQEFEWFWLFPAPGLVRSSSRNVRWHLHEGTLGKALSTARRKTGLGKRVTAHTLRHSFATAALQSGMPIHELQQLMGHASIQTTEIYLHCLPLLSSRSVSPLDTATMGEPSKIISFPFPEERKKTAVGI